MQGDLGCWDTESRVWWLLCQSFAHVGIQGKDFDPKTCIFLSARKSHDQKRLWVHVVSLP